VSIQKLHRDEIRDKLYDARVSTVHFVGVVLYDPENGEKVCSLQGTMHSVPRVIY